MVYGFGLRLSRSAELVVHFSACFVLVLQLCLERLLLNRAGEIQRLDYAAELETAEDKRGRARAGEQPQRRSSDHNDLRLTSWQGAQSAELEITG